MTAVLDTFDRANSATSLGTASDGGTWTVLGSGQFGITSNKAYLPTYSATGAQTFASAAHDLAYRDLGAASCDMQVTCSRSSTSNHGVLVFAYDPTGSGSGYALIYDSTTFSQLVRFSGGSSVTEASAFLAAFSSSTATLKVTYNSSTGIVTVYEDTVQKTTWTDGSPLTGTKVGFGSAAATVDTWDNLSAYALGSRPGAPPALRRSLVLSRSVARASVI